MAQKKKSLEIIDRLLSQWLKLCHLQLWFSAIGLFLWIGYPISLKSCAKSRGRLMMRGRYPGQYVIPILVPKSSYTHHPPAWILTRFSGGHLVISMIAWPKPYCVSNKKISQVQTTFTLSSLRILKSLINEKHLFQLFQVNRVLKKVTSPGFPFS